MKALVTGGAGFIGSAIARELAARGDEVIVLDNLSAGSEDAVPSEAKLLTEDIRDLSALKSAMQDVDIVFHQAAIRSVPRSVEEPHLVNETNITGTLNVLTAATEAGVDRVIYASSSSGYGGSTGQMSRETDVAAPHSPYAVSKLAAEYYCRVWTEIRGLSTVSLRYFNVFGPGQRADSKYAAVFPSFIDSLLKGEAPEIQWDGDQTRDFTFIDDVVRANLAAAAADNQVDGRVLNIASGRPKSINDVFSSLSTSMDMHIEPIRTPKRKGDIRHSYADISLARALLNWEPRCDWEDAIRRTLDWFVAQNNS